MEGVKLVIPLPQNVLNVAINVNYGTYEYDVTSKVGPRHPPAHWHRRGSVTEPGQLQRVRDAGWADPTGAQVGPEPHAERETAGTLRDHHVAARVRPVPM